MPWGPFKFFQRDFVQSPFVILFQGRTGSTHLVSLLDSHPDIKCRSEDFSFDWKEYQEKRDSEKLKTSDPKLRRVHFGMEKYGHNPSTRDIRKHLDSIYRSKFRAAGFKWKFPPQVKGFPEVEEYFQEINERLKVIVLDRKNVLKRAISRFVLSKMQDENIDMHRQNIKKSVNYSAIEIDVEKIVQIAMRSSKDRKKLKVYAKRFENVLHVEYEDLLYKQHWSTKRILRFLDLSPNEHKLRSRYKKATPDCLQNAIVNYDELCEAVKGTELEEMLD